MDNATHTLYAEVTTGPVGTELVALPVIANEEWTRFELPGQGLLPGAVAWGSHPEGVALIITRHLISAALGRPCRVIRGTAYAKAR